MFIYEVQGALSRCGQMRDNEAQIMKFLSIKEANGQSKYTIKSQQTVLVKLSSFLKGRPFLETTEEEWEATKVGIFKRTKCKICGKKFSSFRSASYYCQSCLKSYPRLKPHSTTCYNPPCKHIGSKLETFPSLGTHGYCKLHEYEFTDYSPVGKVDCPDHEPAEP